MFCIKAVVFDEDGSFSQVKVPTLIQQGRWREGAAGASCVLSSQGRQCCCHLSSGAQQGPSESPQQDRGPGTHSGDLFTGASVATLPPFVVSRPPSLSRCPRVAVCFGQGTPELRRPLQGTHTLHSFLLLSPGSFLRTRVPFAPHRAWTRAGA